MAPNVRQDTISQNYYGQGVLLGSLSQSNMNNNQQFFVLDGSNQVSNQSPQVNPRSNNQGNINGNQQNGRRDEINQGQRSSAQVNPQSNNQGGINNGQQQNPAPDRSTQASNHKEMLDQIIKFQSIIALRIKIKEVL